MRILIAYAGKTGGSAEMAELLARLLPNHSVTLLDLRTQDISPEGYDYVVLGGAIRFAKLPREAKEYLKKYEKALSALPHTLFLCCAFAEQFENYADRVFSKSLRESAEEILYFGGELNLSAQRGFDKLLVRMMRNSIKESEDDEAVLPGLLPEHVRLLADRLRQR